MYVSSPLVANRAFAFIALMALLLWSIGFPTWIPHVGAASLTSVRDTLSDSDLGVVSNHTIQFSSPTGIANGDTVILTFEEEFNLSTSTAILEVSDFDVATSSGAGFTQLTLDSGSCGSNQWAVATSGQTITFTVCDASGAIAADATTTIFIGTNASSSGTGIQQIINSEGAGSFEITLGGSMTDSGETRVAIIDDVVVTAAVDTNFAFSINSVAIASSVNGSPTTTATTTTATSIPFGTLTAANSITAAQDLTVTTNAANGFIVTVEANNTLLSSTGADIDTFANGGASSTADGCPCAWVPPNGSLNAENTYGHWGLTSEDDLNSDEYGTDQWDGAFVGTPRQVFENDGPSDGTTANIGATRVGYQIEISALQEAGNDYTATLTYVATPTF